MSVPRLATVQHRVFVSSKELIAFGAPEPYNGMAFSLNALDDFVSGRSHLIVSVEATLPRQIDGCGGEFVLAPKGRGPRIFANWIWAGSARSAVLEWLWGDRAVVRMILAIRETNTSELSTCPSALHLTAA